MADACWRDPCCDLSMESREWLPWWAKAEKKNHVKFFKLAYTCRHRSSGQCGCGASILYSTHSRLYSFTKACMKHQTMTRLVIQEQFILCNSYFQRESRLSQKHPQIVCIAWAESECNKQQALQATNNKPFRLIYTSTQCKIL